MIDKAHQLLQRAKAVIFDMDGVLVDTMPFWEEAKKLFLERHTIPHDQLIPQTYGMGLKDIIELYKEQRGLQGDTAILAAEFREIVYQLLKEKGLLPLPGTIAFVSTLSLQKSLAVATGGHTGVVAKELLADVGLAQYFTYIISSDEVKKGKPAPDVFLFAAEKLGQKPEHCVVVEDAVNGVMAGVAGKIPVIGVNKHEETRKKLLTAGATTVVSSFEDLL